MLFIKSSVVLLLLLWPFCFSGICCEWMLSYLLIWLTFIPPVRSRSHTHMHALNELFFYYQIFFPSYSWVCVKFCRFNCDYIFDVNRKKHKSYFINWKKEENIEAQCVFARSNWEYEIMNMWCDSMDSYCSSLNSYLSLAFRPLFFSFFGFVFGFCRASYHIYGCRLSYQSNPFLLCKIIPHSYLLTCNSELSVSLWFYVHSDRSNK